MFSRGAAGTLLVSALLLAGWAGYSFHKANLAEPHHIIQDIPQPIILGFQRWKTIHEMRFSTPLEENYRLKTFFKNYKLVADHMSQDYKLKLNAFAHLSEEEFVAKFAIPSSKRNQVTSQRQKHQLINQDIPTSVDWRTQGAVTPVKNQMDCGSGWAFAAASAFESAAKISGFPLVPLSEQQLVDCSNAFGNSGCRGGWIDYSYDYILSYGGLESDAQYPYRGSEQRCKSNSTFLQPPKLQTYVEVQTSDCSALLSAVAQQPVATRIASNAIQFYSSGIFSNKYCGTELNQGVLIVGYGTDSHNKKNYWIAKNSWGPSWGEHGYIYLDRDVMTSTGICGICIDSIYPVVKKPTN